MRAVLRYSAMLAGLLWSMAVPARAAYTEVITVHDTDKLIRPPGRLLWIEVIGETDTPDYARITNGLNQSAGGEMTIWVDRQKPHKSTFADIEATLKATIIGDGVLAQCYHVHCTLWIERPGAAPVTTKAVAPQPKRQTTKTGGNDLGPCNLSHDPKNDQQLWATKACEGTMLGKDEYLDTASVVDVNDVKQNVYPVRNKTGTTTLSGSTNLAQVTNSGQVTVNIAPAPPPKCYRYWPQPDITLYELAILVPYASATYERDYGDVPSAGYLSVTIGTQTRWAAQDTVSCFYGQKALDEFENLMGAALRHWKEVPPQSNP